MNGKNQAYKIFDENLQCRGFQYEVGKTYYHDGSIELCESGFHFCEHPINLFNYYSFNSTNRVCVIEYGENTIHGEDKSVTSEITIVREIAWNEVLSLTNSGSDNTGCGNTGYKNSGNGNSGNGNSGYRNSGNGNSGDWNSGDWNSGDWNSTNYSSGIFNSTPDKLRIFNMQTDITMEEFLTSDNYKNVRYVAIEVNLPLTYWLLFSEMDEAQKETYAEFAIQGGVLLTRDYKEACKIWWDSIPEELKEEFINWKYFDAEVFEEITGIHV